MFVLEHFVVVESLHKTVKEKYKFMDIFGTYLVLTYIGTYQSQA